MKAATLIPTTLHPVRRLLRVPEVMSRLGLGRSKVYDLMESGRLKSLKIDGARRVEESALEEFIAGLSGSAE